MVDKSLKMKPWMLRICGLSTKSCTNKQNVNYIIALHKVIITMHRLWLIYGSYVSIRLWLLSLSRILTFCPTRHFYSSEVLTIGISLLTRKRFVYSTSYNRLSMYNIIARRYKIAYRYLSKPTMYNAINTMAIVWDQSNVMSHTELKV